MGRYAQTFIDEEDVNASKGLKYFMCLFVNFKVLSFLIYIVYKTRLQQYIPIPSSCVDAYV